MLLGAYSRADLQKIKNVLVQADRGGLSVGQVLAAIERQLGRDGRADAGRLARPHGQQNGRAPVKRCPQEGCSGMMRIAIADEQTPELGVWECRKCRYSIYEGKTVLQLIEEG